MQRKRKERKQKNYNENNFEAISIWNNFNL